MLRQRAFPILLAFLLLLTQQMGISHAVSHLSAERISTASQGKQLPSEMQCAQCLAFTAIGSALTSSPLALFAGLTASPVTLNAPTEKFLRKALRAFDSRAPPVSFL